MEVSPTTRTQVIQDTHSLNRCPTNAFILFDILAHILSYIHPTKVHSLWRVSKAFYACIRSISFTSICLTQWVPKVDKSTESSLSPSPWDVIFFELVPHFQTTYARNYLSNLKYIHWESQNVDWLLTIREGINPVIFFNAAIPKALCSLLNLVTLNLKDTNIVGELPPEIGLLTEIGCLKTLIILDLDYNRFESAVPSEIGQLDKLRHLSLKDNRITSIPSELWSLPSLQYLNFSKNPYLRMGIPPEIGNLRQLQELHMSELNLYGCIPPEICLLKNLQKLYLNDNCLSGEVPGEMLNLMSLRKCSLQANLGLKCSFHFPLAEM
ncbi:L domain-like protein [Rhizoclosmatium globosum]|uniref:L domain-like protein n=1 Tax=Rhizoclosmatium globosum TaxID=329046 RepID=A0A1Y2C2J1_9FUNG|nr:L domain-like protein [Rhizoclosmatium globosum]|eukprot:ORY41258.1 L domain-like protein [Rhizoclosmatium globosum]